MPMSDPLDTIMNTLRSSGSVDHNTKVSRMARMKDERARLGAAPGMYPGEQPPAPAAQPQQVQQTPQTGAGILGQTDLTPVIVDQLNETIISLKIQIHRERDPQRRRSLEQQAETIRTQITNLGGEPIWAYETVEEGLQKLKGYGYVGGDRLNNILSETGVTQNWLDNFLNKPLSQTIPQAVKSAGSAISNFLNTPVSQQIAGAVKSAQVDYPGLRGPAPQQPQQSIGSAVSHALEQAKSGTRVNFADIMQGFRDADASSVAGTAVPEAPTGGDPLATTLDRIGAAKATTMPTTTVTATKYPAPPAIPERPVVSGALVSIRDVIENIPGGSGLRLTYDPATNNVIVSGPTGDVVIAPKEFREGRAYATEGEIMQAALSAGANVDLMKPGAPLMINGQRIDMPVFKGVTADEVKSVLAQFGFDMSGMVSEDEWVQTRVMETIEAYERAKIEWRQQIDKFKRDSEAAYAVAERKVMKAADKLKAEQQEDMAARGMFYSSIMAQNISAIDEETMNILSDIAIEAANKVADMEGEVTRLEEQKILAATLAEHQAKVEYQDRAFKLAESFIGLQYNIYQMEKDQFLTQWNQYQDLRTQQIEQAQYMLEQTRATQGAEAMRSVALSNPYMYSTIQSYGLLDQVLNGDPNTVSMLLEAVFGQAEPLQQEKEKHDVTMANIVAETQMTYAQINAIGIENAIKMSQRRTTNLVNAYINGDITDDGVISRMREAGLLSTSAQEDAYESLVKVKNIMDMNADIVTRRDGELSAGDKAIINAGLGVLNRIYQNDPDTFRRVTGTDLKAYEDELFGNTKGEEVAKMSVGQIEANIRKKAALYQLSPYELKLLTSSGATGW